MAHSQSAFRALRDARRSHPDHRDRAARLPVLAPQLRGRDRLLQDRDGAGSLRNFAVGTAYSKTETVQATAVFGIVQWRVASLVGVSGMLGSAGWFTAMTLENAAYVRAVGQVELVFTFIASCFFFRERSTALELAGIVLIVGGIVILLLG